MVPGKGYCMPAIWHKLRGIRCASSGGSLSLGTVKWRKNLGVKGGAEVFPQVHGNVDKRLFLWGIREVTLEYGWTECAYRVMVSIKERTNSVTLN